MAYIDYEYYTNIFGGVDIDLEEFIPLSSRASDFIDLKTFYRIDDITKLDASVQNRIKKATAMYTEQFYQQGGIDAYTGFSESLTSNTVSIGKVSMSGGSGEGSKKGITSTGGIVNNPIADQILMSTGLCYRGGVF